MAVLIPHLDIPLRYVASKPVTVEQDSIEDIINCVEAILRTFRGQRLEAPSFGIEDPSFYNQPIDLQTILSAVLDQEPRAAVLIEQHPDTFDALIDDVLVKVSTNQEAQA